MYVSFSLLNTLLQGQSKDESNFVKNKRYILVSIEINHKHRKSNLYYKMLLSALGPKNHIKLLVFSE